MPFIFDKISGIIIFYLLAFLNSGFANKIKN